MDALTRNRRAYGKWIGARAGTIPVMKALRWIVPLTILSSACVGFVGDGGGSGASDEGDGGAGGPGAGGGAGANTTAGPHALQRLTADEIRNTLRDLLGLSSTPNVALPVDGVNESGFAAPGDTGQSDARAILEATETVVGGLSDAAFSGLLGCSTATRDDACVSSFITQFGTRAYRRPLDASEAADLQGLYQGQITAGAAFADAARLVLEGMLNAPGFLYHTEGMWTPRQPDASGLVKLGGYELASRLSYFLTRTMPDAALFAAAAGGGLDTPDGIAGQVIRLLATPAARQTIGEFGAEWLQSDGVLSTGKDTTTYPRFTPAVQASMAAETRAFFQNVILDGDHSWTTLMTASYSMLDQTLAGFYGVGGVTSSTPQEVPLDPTRRFGFLTQGAILATQSNPTLESPIFRGKLIETRLLCVPMGPPPRAFPPPSAPPGQAMTVRQMLEQVHGQPGCNSCHGVLDPPGFAFGHYDATGQWQDTENGLPLDTTGSMTLPSGATLSFQNARDLVFGLAQSDDAKDCFTRQWYRFALQRQETAGEAPAVSASHRAFSTADLDVRQLVLSVATSIPFRYRALAAGEVTP